MSRDFPVGDRRRFFCKNLFRIYLKYTRYNERIGRETALWVEPSSLMALLVPENVRNCFPRTGLRNRLFSWMLPPHHLCPLGTPSGSTSSTPAVSVSVLIPGPLFSVPELSALLSQLQSRSVLGSFVVLGKSFSLSFGPFLSLSLCLCSIDHIVQMTPGSLQVFL